MALEWRVRKYRPSDWVSLVTCSRTTLVDYFLPSLFFLWPHIPVGNALLLSTSYLQLLYPATVNFSLGPRTHIAHACACCLKRNIILYFDFRVRPVPCGSCSSRRSADWQRKVRRQPTKTETDADGKSS